MTTTTYLAKAAADLRSDDAERRARGVRCIQALQREGDPTATYAVGTWLLHGTNGYSEDVEKAATCFQYAADRGVADAIYDLGQLTEAQSLGQRPRRDAFNRYLTAALLGDRDAQDEVVRCVYHGIGTFADPAGAERIHHALHPQQQAPFAAE